MKLDLNKILHEHAYLNNGTLERDTYRISKNAIRELGNWIENTLEYLTPELCKLAKRDKRRTIQEKDIIHLRSRKGGWFFE